MAYFLAFLFGFSGFVEIWNNGVSQQPIYRLIAAFVILLWIWGDKYRSKNRKESIYAGVVFFVCGFAALLNHRQGDYGFFFWCGVTGAIMGIVNYFYYVWIQIETKRLNP